MKPLDDWMELRLWEAQAAMLDVKLELPQNYDKEKDEAAVFEVLSVGPDGQGRVCMGDVVQIAGYGNVARIKLPNSKYTIVAKAGNVCFIMEQKDLTKGA
jgi:hypothetical protein